jgi:hypothetical protein
MSQPRQTAPAGATLAETIVPDASTETVTKNLTCQVSARIGVDRTASAADTNGRA